MAGDSGAQIYDAALRRRQALMGESGPAALLKNGKVFSIAAFATIGGVLYGYNQGMFSGVLAMPSFQSRKSSFSSMIHFLRKQTIRYVLCRLVMLQDA